MEMIEYYLRFNFHRVGEAYKVFVSVTTVLFSARQPIGYSNLEN
jgi:hypothetical protein